MDKHLTIDNTVAKYFSNNELFKNIDQQQFRSIHHTIPPTSHVSHPLKNVNFVKSKVLNIV